MGQAHQLDREKMRWRSVHVCMGMPMHRGMLNPAEPWFMPKACNAIQMQHQVPAPNTCFTSIAEGLHMEGSIIQDMIFAAVTHSP